MEGKEGSGPHTSWFNLTSPSWRQFNNGQKRKKEGCWWSCCFAYTLPLYPLYICTQWVFSLSPLSFYILLSFLHVYISSGLSKKRSAASLFLQSSYRQARAWERTSRPSSVCSLYTTTSYFLLLIVFNTTDQLIYTTYINLYGPLLVLPMWHSPHRWQHQLV